ncbi:MAG: translesion error-prone DNA polymerase V autoproteolytic subunit [Prochlorococcaceae cyanobacterium]
MPHQDRHPAGSGPPEPSPPQLSLPELSLLGPLPPPGRRLRWSLPLAGATVAAGFPSPADDYVEGRIDLNEALIRHPSSTFFLRVSGDSMRGAGILDGDLLVVDRAIEPRAGLVVVAVIEGAFTLKHLRRHRGRWRLEAAHPDYPPLELDDGDDSRIWGVAIHAIHSL